LTEDMTFEQKSSIPLQTLGCAVVTTPQPAPVLGSDFYNACISLKQCMNSYL
jgi:hypothetical protein